MLPSHKLPSFRLGNIEVVTAVAQAAVASHLASVYFQLKKIFLLLIVDLGCMILGWNNFHKTTTDTAFSHPDVIGRMVYGNNTVTKQLQIFFGMNILWLLAMCNFISPFKKIDFLIKGCYLSCTFISSTLVFSHPTYIHGYCCTIPLCHIKSRKLS